MRFSYLSSTAVLFLLPAVSTAVTDRVSTDQGLTPRDFTTPDPIVPARDGLAPKATPKGTLDAPFDGKDGRPHAGPWVETNAERDRKKAGTVKTAEEGSGPETKPVDHQHMGPDGKPIPHSNDGVMDDPHRTGPKEGTRGTEGGVSGKLKGNTPAGEKIPDSPKEAPPLPHSEQKKLSTSEQTEEGKEAKGSAGNSNLGVLEVECCRLLFLA
jgi:hypothetical protein